MTILPDGDEMTELVDANFDRVDLVGKGANGFARFLIAKQDDAGAGLLPADLVRGLIEKAEPGEPGRERVTMPTGVTLSGSPADIAAFIHKAAVLAEPGGYDEIVKAKYSAADRKGMAGNEAMDDGSYPVKDDDDLDHAVKAVGRGGADHDEIRRHVIKRAKAMGKASKIPDNWASDGSLKDASVSKAAGDPEQMGDGLDPAVALAGPVDGVPGDPLEPGSPAWEATDAATACKWTAILSRAKRAIGLLAEREMIEAVTADPGDAGNAMDLDEACCAIDYAISVLAPFAVSEAAEAEDGAEAMSLIGKAVAGFDTDGLDQIDGLAAVVKAGRVLSARNEAAIRAAAASLNAVLASLPQAPQVTDSGHPVAKEQETPMGDHDTTATGPADVEKAAGQPEAPEQAEPAAAAVAKDGDGAMVAVYNSTGQLIGVTDPASVTPVAAEMPCDDDGADDAGDLDPEPPADAGVPAAGVAKEDTAPDAAGGGETPDDVAKEETPEPGPVTPGTITTTADVLKSTIADAVSAAVAALVPAEAVAKQGDDAGDSEEVTLLKARVRELEEEPVAPKVFTSGQVPPAHMLRGQDQGATTPPADIAKAAELKTTLYKGTAAEQQEAFTAMQELAVAELSAIHSGQRG